MQNYRILKNFFGDNAHWQVNKFLAKKLGLESAILLADLFSKSLYFLDNNKDDDGFFFNTRENIENDTTLSPFHQRKCINILIKEGFLDIKEKGLPKKMYYRVNYDKLLAFLTSSNEVVNDKWLNNLTTDSENNAPLSNNKNKGNKNKSNNMGAEAPESDEPLKTEFIDEEKILNKNIGEVIKQMADKIDPKNKLYFNNKTQREATKFLITTYTYENTLKMIDFISEYRDRLEFMPTITTPCEMRDKWVKVMSLFSREKIKSEKIADSFV